jgi:hypothetical protein
MSDDYVYFRDLAGSGTIHCNDCGFNDEAIGFQR